jgi:hypothetical protein
VLSATDGIGTTQRRDGDPLAAPLPDHPYQLGRNAGNLLEQLGVAGDVLASAPANRRPLLRFCLDWSEQRHHLGGRLGATILSTLERSRWISRRPNDRAVALTDLGHQKLNDLLGVVTAGGRAP